MYYGFFATAAELQIDIGKHFLFITCFNEGIDSFSKIKSGLEMKIKMSSNEDIIH